MITEDASTEAGLSGFLKAYLEDHNMFVSTAGSNKEKWARIVRDAVSSEYHRGWRSRVFHGKLCPRHLFFNFCLLSNHKLSLFTSHGVGVDASDGNF